VITVKMRERRRAWVNSRFKLNTDITK